MPKTGRHEAEARPRRITVEELRRWTAGSRRLPEPSGGQVGAALLRALGRVLDAMDAVTGRSVWTAALTLLAALPLVLVEGLLASWLGIPTDLPAGRHAGPTVRCDVDGLYVGQVLPVLVAWEEVESVAFEAGMCHVHHWRGQFRFDPSEAEHRPVAHALRELLRARRRGDLLPGELTPDERAAPDGAISLARLTGEEDTAQRGISLAEDDGGGSEA